MKKYYIAMIFIILSLNAAAQLKIGFRSGAGAFFDLGGLGFLEPKDYNTYFSPTVSEFGNPLPRLTESKRVYLDFAHQHEVFVTYKKIDL